MMFYSIVLEGQYAEFFTGGNVNRFYISNDSENYSSIAALGYSVGFAIGGLKPFYFPIRIGVHYDKYSGAVSVAYRGGGGSASSNVNTVKSTISFALYPIDITVYDKVRVSLGAKYSLLVNESFTGSEQGWSMPNNSWSFNLQDKYKRFNSKNTTGLILRTSYEIELNKSISISPQYSAYLGVSEEFKGLFASTKSLRNFVGVGIVKKFNFPQINLP